MKFVEFLRQWLLPTEQEWHRRQAFECEQKAARWRRIATGSLYTDNRLNAQGSAESYLRQAEYHRTRASE